MYRITWFGATGREIHLLSAIKHRFAFIDEPATTLSSGMSLAGYLISTATKLIDSYGISNVTGYIVTTTKNAMLMTIGVLVDDGRLQRSNAFTRMFNYSEQSVRTQNYCNLTQSNGTSAIARLCTYVQNECKLTTNATWTSKVNA